MTPHAHSLETQTAQAFARFEALRARAGEESHDELLTSTLRELGDCLEELRAANEAHRQQSAALVAARKALVAERTTFQMLFEFAPDGYLVTDPLGVILRANRMAGELLGVARENLVRKPLTVFVGLAERPAFRALLRRVGASEGGMMTFEAKLVARGGRSFDASIRVATGEDLRWTIRDVTEQRRDQRALHTAHQRLEVHAGALQHEVDEQRLTEDRLRQSEGRYRELSAHLHGSIEEERARIAREVHDELGAALTAIRFELSSLRGAVRDDELMRTLAASIERTDAAIRTTRRICSELRPSLLDHMGLWPAIEWLVEDLAGRAGIRAATELHDDAEQEPKYATAIFRIVQEAVTNVVRHSGASNLRVVASANGADRSIEVCDDGCGIRDTELARPDAFGIIGMQERARACGGSLAVERAAKGTRVTLRVPLAVPLGGG